MFKKAGANRSWKVGQILTSCHPFLALILALATIRFVVN